MSKWGDWLEAQTYSLRVWAQRTRFPLVVSTANGQILWANQAFEALLGYSIAELEVLDWKSLTVDPKELRADEEMVEFLLEGHRAEYEQQKGYRHKLGHTVECLIHVLRYPLSGERVDFFLVSCMELDENRDMLTRQMETLRLAFLEQAEAMSEILRPHQTPTDRFFEWARDNKGKSSLLFFLFCYLLFGERAIEVFERAIQAFTHSGGQ